MLMWGLELLVRLASYIFLWVYLAAGVDREL
jgi:hypothetical protein